MGWPSDGDGRAGDLRDWGRPAFRRRRSSHAACAFLAGTEPARSVSAATGFALGTTPGGNGLNIHPWLMRHGVCLADLGHDQREAALAVMRESLSAAGYQLAHDVMRLNEHALEITGKAEEYSEWLYWVSYLRHAVGGRAVGLADRRPPPQPQLLCPRRPAGDDADLHGVGAGLGAVWQIQGNPRLGRRGGAGYALMDACRMASGSRRR